MTAGVTVQSQGDPGLYKNVSAVYETLCTGTTRTLRRLHSTQREYNEYLLFGSLYLEILAAALQLNLRKQKEILNLYALASVTES